MRPKYINPFTDFGFKKIFGEEASKPLLIDFLNTLLPVEHQISELSFQNPEQLPQSDADRKAVYDIYCVNQNGERFIVELQKVKQNFFKDRTIYYSTFPIQQQAEQGEWNYRLKAVYCIGVLDFRFNDYIEPKNEVIHVVKLKDQNSKVFYDKLTFIYLEMPNFDRLESELETRLDQWLFFIKNLGDLQSIPELFKDAVFTKAFEKAELARLEPKEWDSYQYSLKILRDNYAVWEYALQEAIAQGKLEGKLEIAKKLLARGLSLEEITEMTELTRAELQNLI